MSTTLVTGATGTLGREVVQRLLDRERNLRAYVRGDGSSLPEGVEAFSGDIKTGSGLSEAVRGVDAIVHCATFFEADNATDLDGARHLIEAARQNGSPHLVYISIVGIDESEFSYFQGKRQVEEMIERSGLPFTIQRATQFHDFVLTLIASFENDEASAIMLPTGLRFQPVDAGEVAEALAGFAGQQASGRALDIGGPEILTLEEMATEYIKIFNKMNAIKTETTQSHSDFHEAFRSGTNLAPNRAIGRTSWEMFLRAKLDPPTLSPAGSE